MQKYLTLALCSPTLKLSKRKKCFLHVKRNVFGRFIKKMILRKKIKKGNWFLAGLSAIYLAKSVLHLKYEEDLYFITTCSRFNIFINYE